MDVVICDDQTDLKLNHEGIKQAADAVVALEGQEADEVIVHFVTTADICELHGEFFNDPSPTDCISFPIGEDHTGLKTLGEVFICPETAINYCKEHGGDPYEETLLYFVHTLLHIMGYKDEEDADIAAMRQAEKRHMDHLKSLDISLIP